MKILHIAEPQTFTKPFFFLIERKFKVEDHAILSRGKSNDWPHDLKIANKTLTGFAWALALLKSSKQSEKIILHGLWDLRLIVLLCFHPNILAKCYWIIWGGDLYSYKSEKKSIKWRIAEIFRRSVIRRMGHLVTYVPGDVELARKWYGATGQYHECIMYTSNIYRDYTVKKKFHKTVNIQIGNSADPSNNHLDILEKLKPFQGMDIAIYAPLSYGDAIHAKKVIDAGKAIFGEKFKPLTELMPFDQYLEFLGKVDVAIFNHRRQQGMGNTITLLGLGKKVYMRSDVTPWSLFSELELNIYDFETVNATPISELEALENKAIISDYFSEKKLIEQYSEIFR